MTTAITYTIPGARTLDQLHEGTLDGHPDENARENCVAVTLADGLNTLLHPGAIVFVGDELKDAVYGQGTVGVESAQKYVAYCADRGVRLSAVSGTQAQLVATIHREVSAGHPVVVTMPSNWNTAPADPLHPSGYTHVGLAVGIGPDGIRVMNPWHGFMQDATDEWWAARLCEGQVWVMQKVSSTTMAMTSATTGVPAGWHDDGKTLTAPNGITVGTGMRDKVLSWPGGWPAWNVPLEEERDMASLELSNPALGAGTQQVFRATVLEWTEKAGVFVMAVGAELQATRAALTKAEVELTGAQQQMVHDAATINDQRQEINTLTQQVAALQAAAQASIQQAQAAQSEAQAESSDELARGAAHAFVQAFTAAVAQAVASTPSADPAATAATVATAGGDQTIR